jgi:Family of unknown function (DUF6510)
MDNRELMLDGNAIGGVMRDIFSLEITTARATCASCRATGRVGTLPTYVHAPGVVVRCPHCDRVLMRLVHGGERYWLDLSGTISLELQEDA